MSGDRFRPKSVRFRTPQAPPAPLPLTKKGVPAAVAGEDALSNCLRRLRSAHVPPSDEPLSRKESDDQSDEQRYACHDRLAVAGSGRTGMVQLVNPRQ